MGAVEESPLGRIWTAVSDAGLVAVSLWDDPEQFTEQVARLTGCPPELESERVTAVTEQIQQYLHKERTSFDLAIDWSVMTPFQASALRVVYGIEYGRTLTYRDVAQQIGKPKAVRAVGRANATNPMPLVIPCHRVLGSDGKLHGFGAPGGLATKAWLLRMEESWPI
ncbi:MAG: methylated-DNA--[protein]-cysteine S-methyltransferase [Ardenticatenaceae bacterium]|nr:methylated-DNA--[protein]-cysteine S-methyltransferase [Ardenticatenaceae bacterium]